MGIERVCARRATSSVIWSDNGTNFVASKKTPVQHQQLESASPRGRTHEETN